MKTIIAAVDFSKDSLNAANYAADLASVTGCGLLLLHVCPYPIGVDEAGMTYIAMGEAITDAETTLENLKTKLIARSKGTLNVSTVVKEGDIVAGIKECGASVNTFAVVVGRGELGALQRTLIGSRAVAAVKRLSWPVITVPLNCQFTHIRNIGIACDFSDVIDTFPTKEITDMVRATNAKLHVLHIQSPASDKEKSITMKESGVLHQLLASLKPQYYYIRNENAEDGIIDFAATYHLDLLVIIPKHHSLFEKIFTHLHARNLVLHAHLPVMSVHG